LLHLVVSAMLGVIIGLERERLNQPAGLRTHMILVAGATLAMTLSINLAIQFHPLVPTGDPARLTAQEISGIGFLGDGAMLRFGTRIKGLTTATSIWTMAVVGLMVGAGYYLTGIAATLFLLFILTLLNQIEKRMVPVQKVLHFLIEVQDRPQAGGGQRSETAADLR
jgi:putative Mg2+ transporter-C (MgtC) family protein